MPTPMLIFLPVRNGGDYLATAIRSVLAQSDPDWRLIVLENASTDATVAMVEGFADPRIELLASERPLDITANWVRILTWLDTHDARDQLVTTIGHDDSLSPSFVAAIRRLAADNPAATLFQAAFDLIDSAGRRIRPCRPIPTREEWQDLAAAMCWGIRDSYGTGYAFRARDYRSVGGFPAFPKLIYADHLLFIRLARLGYKCATDAVLCQYRLHDGSASSSVSGATLDAYAEGLDLFVAALTGELAEFISTERGRNALGCLIGREIVSLGRPAIQPLLSTASRARMIEFKAQLASLAPDMPPEAWVQRRSRWVQRLERLVDTVVVTRIRWRQRRR